MKKEYDFSNAVKNPYYDKDIKKQISINVSKKTIDYFKKMAQSKGVPYQILINLFLNDCVEKKKDIVVV